VRLMPAKNVIVVHHTHFDRIAVCRQVRFSRPRLPLARQRPGCASHMGEALTWWVRSGQSCC
jgi:hypothetical protein